MSRLQRAKVASFLSATQCIFERAQLPGEWWIALPRQCWLADVPLCVCVCVPTHVSDNHRANVHTVKRQWRNSAIRNQKRIVANCIARKSMQNKADIRTDEFSGIRCIFGQATKLVELVFDLKTDPYCVLDGLRICPRKRPLSERAGVTQAVSTGHYLL